MLELFFRSGAEVAVLGVVLFSDGLHLREIARRAGVSPPEAKRELGILVSAGVLKRESKGNLSLYSLDPKCPFLPELKGLYVKAEGPVPMLKAALSALPGVRYAFVYGSFAGGTFAGSSDIDLLVVGSVKTGRLDQACFRVQEKTGREINYILWSNEDFARKLRERGAFVSSVIKGGKIWLAGGEDGFKRAVAKP